MHRLSALLVALYFTLLVAGSDNSALCTAHLGNQYYDLSALRAKTDYVAVSEIGERNITLNVCGGVVSETWKLDNPEDVAGFYRGPHSDISVGQVNTTIMIAHGHPILIFSGGTECTVSRPGEDESSNSGIRRSTLVRFICDQSVFSRGTPKLVAQLPPDDDTACAYFVEWRTHVACPTSHPGGSGGPVMVFFIIMFLTFAVYFTAAVFYNRMVLGLRGREQLPTFSFSGLVSLKNFFSSLFTFRSHRNSSQPNWGSWRRDHNAFGPLSTEEDAILEQDGRFSIDEEDESGLDNHILGSGIPPGQDGVLRL